MHSPPTNQAWLDQVIEDTLEPDLPICDPHHHLWEFRTERVAHRYLLDEILADATAQSEQIQNVLRALQSGDQVTQFSLVEALLKSQNKALRRIGREHALFSTNPVMRT